MPAQKEKKQQAFLAGLVAVIGVVVLLRYLPVISLYELNASRNKSIEESGKLEKDIAWIEKAREQKDFEDKKLEEEKKKLKEIQDNLLHADNSEKAYFWFADMLVQETKAYGITLTSYDRGDIDEKILPKVSARLYRTNATLKGDFFKLGSFLAYFENKYPYIAIRGFNLRPFDAKGNVCELKISLTVLTAKEKEKGK